MQAGRAVWLILSRRPWALTPAWLFQWSDSGPIPPILFCLAVGLGAWLLDHLVLHLGLTLFLVIPFALLVGLAAFFINSADPSDPQPHPRHLHPVGPHDLPELHALVAEVAEELGVQRPARIWLWAIPDSIVKRPTPWRTELWLGLPYATEMTVQELRAVVAHELTLAERRRAPLVNAVYRLWINRVARIRPGTGSPKAFLVEAATVAQAVLQEADQAGARLAGQEAMVSALLRGAVITYSFAWFATRYAGPLVKWRSFAVDLYPGWRWKLRHDLECDRGWERIRPSLLEDPRPACSFAQRINAIGGPTAAETTEIPPPPAHQVLLSGLPEAVEGRFSRWYVEQALQGQHRRRALSAYRLRAIRFRDVSPDVWDTTIRQQLDKVLAATARLRGQPTATPQDVIAVVRSGQATDLIWDHKDWMCNHPAASVCALFPVIHRALRSAGYEYANPLRQRELVAPSGDRLDVMGLAERIDHGERPPQLPPSLLEG